MWKEEDKSALIVDNYVEDRWVMMETAEDNLYGVSWPRKISPHCPHAPQSFPTELSKATIPYFNGL